MNELIAGLRDQAAHALKSPKLTSFKDGEYGCPWLTYWERGRHKPAEVEGVILLQDWGVVSTPTKSLTDSAAEIENPQDWDFTIRNLMTSQWGKYIKDGRWIAMNAVWALRTNEPKCNALPESIHRAAYAIWSQILEALIQKSPSLQLVVCGSWSGWNYDFPKQTIVKLDEFICKWNQWTGSGPPLCTFEKGYAYYLSHPCTWHTRPWDGPHSLVQLATQATMLRGMELEPD